MTAHLENTGLLREYRGVWQYRMFLDGLWYCANSRQGAIESAQNIFDSLPESERLTQDQRDSAREAARDAQNDALFGKKSDDELRAVMARLESQLAGHQHAAVWLVELARRCAKVVA